MLVSLSRDKDRRRKLQKGSRASRTCEKYGLSGRGRKRAMLRGARYLPLMISRMAAMVSSSSVHTLSLIPCSFKRQGSCE